MIKTSFAFISIFFSLACFSQRMFYSKEIIKSYQPDYSIIGKVKDNILIWSSNNKEQGSEILVFDAEMNLVRKAKQPGLSNVPVFKFFANNDHLLLGLGKIENNQLVFKVVVFDDMVNQNTAIILDSIKANADSLSFFNYLQSPDGKIICLVKAEADTSRNLLKVDCSFTDGVNHS